MKEPFMRSVIQLNIDILIKSKSLELGNDYISVDHRHKDDSEY